MLRINLILLYVFLLTSQIMVGQNLTKGFSKLKKGETKKALEIFREAIKAKKDVAVAYYGLALCQSDTSNNAKPNFTNAYKSLLEAEKRMISEEEATVNRYRQKYGFGAEMIADKMVEMAERELSRIYSSKYEGAFTSYMRTFKALTTYTESARVQCEKLRWEKAVRANSIGSYEELKKKPIDSVYIVMADSAIESLHWRNAVEKKSLELFDEYEKLYPNANKDSLIAQARYSIRLNRILNNTTLFSNKVSEKDCLDFLSMYPDSPDRDTVWYLAGKHAFAKADDVHLGSSMLSNRAGVRHSYYLMKNALKKYPDHPRAVKTLERLKSTLYKEGMFEGRKGRLSFEWGFYYELFPDGEHAPEVDEYLEKLAKKHYELCDYNEITDFEYICPENYTKRPKDWKRRMEVAKYIHEYGLLGKDKHLVSTIKFCAPYEPAFFALRELLEQPHKESDIDILRRYMNLLPNHKAVIRKMISVLSTPAKKINWKCLGDSINSNLSEYCATFSANGRYLYFTRRKNKEQIWVSTNENGKWGTPRYCSSINNPVQNSDPETIYPNGNEMVYFHEGKLKLARKTDEGKMVATNAKLPFNVGPWNADVQFTFDGNAALFCTASGNVVGLRHEPWWPYMGIKSANIDIFVCLKDSLGNWGKPMNLGPVINTPFIDRSPFLASDMKTLYFASNRHGSLSNETDIFMSKRLKDDSWTEWSEPVNIGTAINSKASEWQLSLSADGSTMYISKNEDLFYAQVPASMRPEPVTLLYGRIENTEGEKVIGYVRWENLATGQKLGEMQADMETGEYFVTLPHGTHYAYYVYKDNYMAESGNVFVDKSVKKSEKIRRDVTLVSEKDVIAGKAEVRMNNVFFTKNSANINIMSDHEIRRFFNFLKDKDFPLIEISGHTDNVGNETANMAMSKKRAEAVKSRLVKLGYDPERITTVGYGSSMPRAENDTEDGRSMNRRVELKIVK